MRFPTTKLSLILILTFIFFTPSFAVISTNTTPSLRPLAQQFNVSKQGAQVSKAQKKEHRIQKFLKKTGIDITNPTDKWLWFGLGLLALAVVMSILPVIRTFSSLVALVGVVFIFIWLFKKLV
jgi:Flp pilus assembly protein TadB